MVNNKPNIVLITADQWRGDCIGSVYDTHPIMTPHINQLVSEGITYINSYSGCPMCMPQRASVLTGKNAGRLNYTMNSEFRTPVDPDKSLPALLKKYAGYQTKGIGKMHFEPSRARLGFEHVTLHPDDYIMYLEENGFCGAYRFHGLGGNEVYPAVTDLPQKYYHTNWIVDQSIKYLYQRDPDNPFFLWIVFEAPHSPFDPPAPYDRMYDNFPIDSPISGDWDDLDCPIDFKAKRISQKFGEISPEVNKELRRRYYGQISNIDYQLGLFFGELKRRGIYDDTLIIFTSDHGELLGDHGLYGKGCFLRGSGDVPMIVKPPKSMKWAGRGRLEDVPVLTTDIFATILDVAGIDEHNSEDSVSLRYISENGIGNRIICGEFGDGFGTAFAYDGQYKYIYYANGGHEQLFDHATDRFEKKNVVRDEKLNDIKTGLKSALIGFLSECGRPMVKNGEFISVEKEYDEDSLRKMDLCAMRGPLHYGQGYGGLSGA